jgi:lipid-A-disaccharide synthase
LYLDKKGEIMKVLVSAVEYSANIHLKSLKGYLSSEVDFVGIFDNSLGNPIADLQSLAVMGVSDAVKKVGLFYKLGNEMVKLAKNVDKVLLIDSSGFNLPLAKKIKQTYPNREIIYYILPQAWVWRRGRIKTLEQNIDKLLSILPFERELYSDSTSIEYVGHPLLDEIEMFMFKKSLPGNVKTVLFMPGSRVAEIKSLMPIFRQVRERFDIPAKIVIPPYFTKSSISEIYGDLNSFEITDSPHRAIYESDFAFICSGTATLEASLIGTPFILTYVAKPFDYFIGKKILRLDIQYAGLANIFSNHFQGRPMHEEFIQDDVTVKNIINSFHSFDREQFIEDSKALRSYLSKGSSRRVAEIIKSAR